MEALSAAMVKAELSECDVRAAFKEHLDSIACHYHNIMVGHHCLSLPLYHGISVSQIISSFGETAQVGS